MHGTIVCGVTDSAESRDAAQLAAALATRLGLRLVLAHVVAGADTTGSDGRVGAEQMLEAIEHAIGDEAETRLVHGNLVDGLAGIAAEEGADVIVLGSRPRGARGRQLRCALACELEAVQSVPVLIAPPATRERSRQRLTLAEAAAKR
ncbi:MAG TPA: universal stress protein [Gaiellaceae bacterium]|nr:universal stress protein [Gaiellaceae bacterium]